MRVLIVDDSPDLVALLVMALERADHETITAGNGLEGLARLQDDPDIDLLLVDASMPLMGGVEMLRALGANRPPALGITCDPDQWGHALLDAGAVEVIGKPFDVLELLAAIARVGA